MKVTKYSIKETDSELTIIIPSPKDRKYKIIPTVAISIFILLGLLTEWAYFKGFFGDTDLSIIFRIGISIFILAFIAICANQLIYLQRGYEYLYIFKPTQHIEFYKKGNWAFSSQLISLQEIVYWGVIHDYNSYAFQEIGIKGRIGSRHKGGCLIFTQRFIYEEGHEDKDTEFGAGLTPTEAKLIAQKISSFLKMY